MPSPKPLALIATLRLNTPDRPKMSARQQNPQQNQHLRQCKGDKQRPNGNSGAITFTQLSLLPVVGFHFDPNCLEPPNKGIVRFNRSIYGRIIRRSKADGLQHICVQCLALN